MIKKILLISIVLFGYLISFAQTSEIDSLKNVLNANNDVKETINTLKKLNRLYMRTGNLEMAESYAKKAIKLCEEINDTILYCYSINNLTISRF
jgi:predicted nucleotidyltransferase